MLPDLRALADTHIEEIVQTAVDLIRIPSFSLREERAAEYVEKKMRRLGYDRVTRDAYGSVFGEVHGAGGGKSVLLNCHLDVVEEGDTSLWRYPPFSGAVADGRIWGRGASDTKGTMAIQLHAPILLRDAGLLPEGDVITAAVVAEENAGYGSMMHCREGRYLTDYAILGEATENDLAIGCRGRCCVKLTLSGRSCHAATPWQGSNPFDLLARLLPALGEIRLAGKENLGSSSVNVTKIESSEKGTNIIPGQVAVYCDCRLAPPDTAENLRSRVQRLADSLPVPGVTAETEVLYFPLTTYTGAEGYGFQGEEPFTASAETPYVQRAKAALEAAVGHPVALKSWPFATDAGHYSARGVKVIGYSPAESAFCHTTDDSISINDMKEGTAGYLALILALSGEK